MFLAGGAGAARQTAILQTILPLGRSHKFGAGHDIEIFWEFVVGDRVNRAG